MVALELSGEFTPMPPVCAKCQPMQLEGTYPQKELPCHPLPPQHHTNDILLGRVSWIVQREGHEKSSWQTCLIFAGPEGLPLSQCGPCVLSVGHC